MIIKQAHRPIVQKVDDCRLSKFKITLDVLREDAIHPVVSGNKLRKLSYNLEEAQRLGFDTLLTFGGAFSNHVAATAAVGKITGKNTIGIIRGEELASKINENATLSYAQECGMKFHFVSREVYRERASNNLRAKLKALFGDFYILPEGGTNDLAVKGCEEILGTHTSKYDYICTSVGTGGTIAGLVKASKAHQDILGFSSTKGTFQKKIIATYTEKQNYTLLDTYCFGGYAKINADLVHFINAFKTDHNIALDPIYTGKMMYGIYDLILNHYFEENSRILAIHTGGLQGIDGMNNRLKKKNLPQIDT